jgi:hypothetical protein
VRSAGCYIASRRGIPLTFVAVPLALFAVGLVAAWIATHRVTRIDPIVALKDL